MYKLKKILESYLRVDLLGPGPRLIKIRIYRAAASQRLRNTVIYLRLCETHQSHNFPEYGDHEVNNFWKAASSNENC
jgi:hypothetical protein